MNSLRILLIWLLTVGVLIGQAVLPNRRKVFQAAGVTTLNDNLIAYWAMEETGDQTVNRTDSQGANDLDAQGTGVTDAPGKIGNAVDLETGSNDRLAINDNADLSFADEDFSFAGWVWMESKPGTMYIMRKFRTDIAEREYLLAYVTGTDRFQFQVSSDGSTTTSVTANTFGSPSTSTWYFVCAGHDSVNNIIWISVNAGTRDTAAHTTGCRDGISQFTLSFASNAWDGLIDEFGVWGKTLSTSEESELYNGGTGITCCPF